MYLGAAAARSCQLSAVSYQPSAVRKPRATSYQPPASSQERRAKSVLFLPQLPSFQDFACKSHRLKILPTNFFASPMESRFYGVPPGRGYQVSGVSSSEKVFLIPDT